MKRKITVFDSLLITLVVLKHCANWDFLARIFNMIVSNFVIHVLKFISIISLNHLGKGGRQRREEVRNGKINHRKKTFKKFTSARYATDDTFQQAYTPTGSHSRG